MEGDVGTSQLTPDTGVSPPERPGSEAPRSPGLRFTSRSVGAQRNRATDLHVDPPAFRYDRSGVPTSFRHTAAPSCRGNPRCGYSPNPACRGAFQTVNAQ